MGACGILLPSVINYHYLSIFYSLLVQAGVIMPIIAATQPINSLAFLMDGIIYGVNGYSYAAVSMFFSAVPASAVMILGSRAVGTADGQLLAIWWGLAILMGLRFVSTYVPLRLRRPPFDVLREKND
jgi:hypothetical protein